MNKSIRRTKTGKERKKENKLRIIIKHSFNFYTHTLKLLLIKQYRIGLAKLLAIESQ